MKRRDAWLWGALSVTLGLTLWTYGWTEREAAPNPAPAAQVLPRAKPDARPEVAAAVEAHRPRAAWPTPMPSALAAWASVPRDMAAPATEAVDVPTAEAQPASATPALMAPPLPWRWHGRLDDAAGPQALLDGPGGARLVRESEVLEGQWRVDRIAPDRMHWTWLPAGLTRTLERS